MSLVSSLACVVSCLASSLRKSAWAEDAIEEGLLQAVAGHCAKVLMKHRHRESRAG